MKKYVNLLQNIGIFTLTNFTTKILNFFLLPLYTYYLTTIEYGTIDLLNTIIQLLYPFFTLTIIEAVLRFSISNKNELKEIFTIGVNVILLGFLFLSIATGIISLFVIKKITLVYFLIIFLVQAINSLLGAFMKALDKVKFMALITTLVSFSILILNIFFITILKQGIQGYWFGTIIGNIIGIILYIFISNPFKYYCIRKNKKHYQFLFKEMLSYSLPLIPNALFWWINSSLDRLTLSYVCGLSVVGLYACANKIPTIISTINTIFSQAWNLSLFENSCTDERNNFYSFTFTIFNEIIFCCTIGVILLSKLLGTLMFSENFYTAWFYIPILTMGVYYNCLNSFLGSMFTATKNTKFIFTTTIIGSLSNIFLNIPMVYIANAIGAAIATLISYLLVYFARSKKLYKLYGIKSNLQNILFQLGFLMVETIIIMNDYLWIMAVIIVIMYYIKFLFYAFSRLKEIQLEKK